MLIFSWHRRASRIAARRQRAWRTTSRTLRCRYSDSAKPPTKKTKDTALRFSAASTSSRCMWPQMGATHATKKACTTPGGSTSEKERGRYSTASAPSSRRAALYAATRRAISSAPPT
jgi:hypothetical protein